MLELGFKELLGHISLLKTKNVGLNQVQVGKSVQTKFKYFPLVMQTYKCEMYANHFGWIENNSSMLLESSCSEVENRKAEVSFSARDLSFSEIGQLFSQA